eukprot:scaffold10208_cov69-Attheya_sp.AAC.1
MTPPHSGLRWQSDNKPEKPHPHNPPVKPDTGTEGVRQSKKKNYYHGRAWLSLDAIKSAEISGPLWQSSV